MAFVFAAARPARQVALFFLPILLLAVGGIAAQAGTAVAAQPASQRQLKAAYLARFAAFVHWPDAAFARPDSPLLIGIAGDDALAAEAERIVGTRLVGLHPVEVRRIAGNTAPPGLHILFVAAPRAHGTLLDAARNRPVLTVCDAAGAGADARPGCVIALVADGERLRVRVDRLEAASAQLRISARLLALAATAEIS